MKHDFLAGFVSSLSEPIGMWSAGIRAALGNEPEITSEVARAGIEPATFRFSG
jgi:hypothetical protein